jgi:hypothetical protein
MPIILRLDTRDRPTCLAAAGWTRLLTKSEK